MKQVVQTCPASWPCGSRPVDTQCIASWTRPENLINRDNRAPNRGWVGGGGWHKASVSDCLPLAAPIGLSPLLILTLCGPERVLVVSTEPPDDLSCLTTPGVGRPGDGLLPVPLTRCIQMHAPSPCGGLPTPALTWGGGGGGRLVVVWGECRYGAVQRRDHPRRGGRGGPEKEITVQSTGRTETGILSWDASGHLPTTGLVVDGPSAVGGRRWAVGGRELD